MAIKQKPIFICDYCGKEMQSAAVMTEDVPNEGQSEIIYRQHRFPVGGQHYCSPACLIRDIEDALGILREKTDDSQTNNIP